MPKTQNFINLGAHLTFLSWIVIDGVEVSIFIGGGACIIFEPDQVKSLPPPPYKFWDSPNILIRDSMKKNQGFSESL